MNLTNTCFERTKSFGNFNEKSHLGVFPGHFEENCESNWIHFFNELLKTKKMTSFGILMYYTQTKRTRYKNIFYIFLFLKLISKSRVN